MTKITEPIEEEEFAATSAALEEAGAEAVCAWAVERFGGDLVVASSFQDCVLIDLMVRAGPRAEVVFLDTGFHFRETLDFVDTVVSRYRLNLVVLRPEVGPEIEPCGAPRCCELRKVAPLNAHLAKKRAWVTGLKRVDTPERADAPVVSFDAVKGLVKINPLAAWSDEEVSSYLDEHGLPRHPLNAAGYVSIGCAPTTRPTAPGEDPRAGRWPDSDKTECGLHL